MPPDLLTRIARRLTRTETFEHLVSPALADLQWESSADVTHWARHYAGLLVVLACAIARDLRVDVSFVVDRDAWRTVWRRSLWWYAGAFVASVGLLWRGIPWHLLDRETRRAALIAGILSTGATALTPTVSAAAFYLRRRAHGLRVLVVGLGLIVVSTQAIYVALGAFRAAPERAVYEQVSETLPPSAAHVGSPDHRWQLWLDWRLEAEQDGSAAWRGAVAALAFALIGLVLAGRNDRRVSVLARLLSLVAIWLTVGVTTILVEMAGGSVPSVTYQRWRDVVLPLTIAGVWLIVDQQRARSRRTADPARP